MATRPRPTIHALEDDARLDERLYAVNLLAREKPWAYELYNLLAYPIVRSVRARPLIKGVGGRLAGGDPPDGPDGVRETLLIVGYPDASAFLKMATDPYFMLVSALRKLGLRDFQFGFTRRLDGGPSRPPGGKSGRFLALFWPPGADFEIGELRRRVSAAGSTLAFAGERKAILAVVDEADDARKDADAPRPTRLAPPLPHGHVAVMTGHERTLTPLADELPPGAAFAVLYERRI